MLSLMEQEQPAVKPVAKIEDIREAARIVSTVLLELRDLTCDGVSLDMLDELAERRVREMGAEPYNKGYAPKWAEKPYPSTICASVDEEICHAPPNGRVLQFGSIVTYDLGIRYKSGCGDAALTVIVGQTDNKRERLMRYAYRALMDGIKKVRAGVRISDIGEAIWKSSIINGYTVIKEFGGHTIGTEMHEEPFIPNYYDKKDDERFLVEGQVICLEPMITPGKGQVIVNPIDGWTASTVDKQPVSMWEHMILVTKDGSEILTTHI